MYQNLKLVIDWDCLERYFFQARRERWTEDRQVAGRWTPEISLGMLADGINGRREAEGDGDDLEPADDCDWRLRWLILIVFEEER